METTVYGTWFTRVQDGTLTLEASVLTALGDFTADYDVDAITWDYKEAVNAALPEGVSLQGDEFHGPARTTDATWGPDLEDEDGRLDLETIVKGVDFWAIATKYDKTITDVEEDTPTTDDQAPYTTAEEWANALDAEMAHTGQTAGELASHGYADGRLLGVTLDPEHAAASDERVVIASASGWVVRYDAQVGYWYAD